MDDRRFDSLTKALASGSNRRSVLKGLLGLGGAAAIGGTVLPGDADAARRGRGPTPTPKPRACPGIQQWDGTRCACPSGLSQCNPGSGPTCCNDQIDPFDPDFSECCENACCQYPNQCVGDEMCCPRLPEMGCLDSSGECCATRCGITPLGVECCPIDEFCPGGSGSDDLCCSGDTPIKCDCGADGNACLPDTDDACCVAADCDTPPFGWVCNVTATCDDHVCHYHHCDEETSCCPDDRGGHACRAGGTCCLTDEHCADACQICGPEWVCIDDPDSFRCGSATEFECCPNGQECSDAGECCAVGHSACGPNCCDPQSQTPQCCNGACVAADVKCCSADHPCDGGCETCAGGACQADPGACLSCQECRFDPATKSNECVDTCPGCESCFADGCRPDDNQCAAPATCCGWTGTCVDLNLENACCVDADCDRPPDACSTGTCGAGNLCTYASSCAGGTCCADGFCTDGPSGCCGDSDCPAIGCSAGTCDMQSRTCAYAPNDAACGDCGICNDGGECVAGTCAGWCKVCKQDSATGQFNCQPGSGCCPPYMAPLGDTCVNACVLLVCPQGCWCIARSDGETRCVQALDSDGRECQSPSDCPPQYSNCVYSEAYGHPICVSNPTWCSA